MSSVTDAEFWYEGPLDGRIAFASKIEMMTRGAAFRCVEIGFDKDDHCPELSQWMRDFQYTWIEDQGVWVKGDISTYGVQTYTGICMDEMLFMDAALYSYRMPVQWVSRSELEKRYGSPWGNIEGIMENSNKLVSQILEKQGGIAAITWDDTEVPTIDTISLTPDGNGLIGTSTDGSNWEWDMATQNWVKKPQAQVSEEKQDQCWHDWTQYVGFNETYDYCTKCDKKRDK